MKKLLLGFSFSLLTLSVFSQNYNPVKSGYKAIDTLHISEYVYSNSVYFISDTRFVYCDINNIDTLIGGVSPFFIGIYDVEKKTIITQMHSQSFELKMMVSKSGKHMVVFDDKGTTVYKINNNESFTLLGTLSDVKSLQTLQSAVFNDAEDMLIIPHARTVSVVDITENGITKRKDVEIEEANVLFSIAMHDKVIAIGNSDGEVFLTDLTLSSFKKIAPLSGDITDIVYSPTTSSFICVTDVGIASFTADGTIITKFELQESRSRNFTTLSEPYKGYIILGSFDYPHKLVSVDNLLLNENLLDPANYLELENVHWEDGNLYFDYRAVGVSPDYKYVALALPWRDIVILKAK